MCWYLSAIKPGFWGGELIRSDKTQLELDSYQLSVRQRTINAIYAFLIVPNRITAFSQLYSYSTNPRTRSIRTKPEYFKVEFNKFEFVFPVQSNVSFGVSPASLLEFKLSKVWFVDLFDSQSTVRRVTVTTLLTISGDAWSRTTN